MPSLNHPSRSWVYYPPFGWAALVVLCVGLILRSHEVSALAGIALAQVGDWLCTVRCCRKCVITETQESHLVAASVLSITITPLALALFPRMLAGNPLLRPLKRRLEGRAIVPAVGDEPEQLTDHVIVIGLGVGGRTVVEALELARIVPLIIELNPMTVTRERDRNRHVVFGDSTSAEVLKSAGLYEARAVVLVVSDPPAAHRTAELIHELRPNLPVLLRTRYVDEEGAERAIGAEVYSEEFAGALSIAGGILRHCQIDNWSEIIEKMNRSHASIPQRRKVNSAPLQRPLSRWHAALVAHSFHFNLDWISVWVPHPTKHSMRARPAPVPLSSANFRHRRLSLLQGAPNRFRIPRQMEYRPLSQRNTPCSPGFTWT